MTRAIPDTLDQGNRSFLDHTRDHERACFGMDIDLFYPGSYASTKVDEAKAVCEGCAVRAECLAFVLTSGADSDEGIWGGTTPAERAAMRARMPKPSRPRRDTCQKGLHLMTPANTKHHPDGSRRCRACHQASTRAGSRQQSRRSA
jgi:WhiB family redox-sensing transcriptional regulator